jgi:hypothetical protein
MRRFVGLMLLFLGMSLGLLAQTSPKNPDPTGGEIRLTKAIGDEEIRKAAERLRGMQGQNIDPKLREMVEKLIRDNPGLSAEQLLQRALAKQPELRSDTELLKGMNSMLQQQTGKMPKLSDFPRSDSANPMDTPKDSPNLRPEPPAPPSPAPTPKTSPETPKLDPQTLPNKPNPGLSPFTPPSAPFNMPKSQDRERFEQLANWYEKNVGPVNQSPAIQEIMKEVILGAGSTDGKSPLSKMLEGADLKGAEGAKSWVERNLNQVKLPDLGSGVGKAPSFVPPPIPDSPTNLGGLAENLSANGSGILIAIVAILAAGGLLWMLWKFQRNAREHDLATVPGLGPWPLDPRKIADRDSFVKAFEYFSVLTLGQESRIYNHRIIAEELKQRRPECSEVAEAIAEFYAIARYTPATEAIPAAILQEARAKLCRLAGVAG